MTSILEKKQKKREKYSLDELKTLGCQLLSSRAHINNLPLLLTFIRPSSPPQYAIESLISLQSFFIPVISGFPSSSRSHPDGDGKSNKDPELVYTTWLRSKFDEFLKAIIVISVCSESDESLRDVALDAVMEFVKLGKGGRFQSAIYYRFLHAIVNSKMLVDFLIDLLSSKFFKYADVCYFTYISLEKLSNSLDTTNTTDSRNTSLHGDDDHISLLSNVDLSIKKLHCILSRISPLKAQDGQSDYEMWSELGFFSKEAHCKGSSKNSNAEEKEHKMKKSNDNALPTSYITRKMKQKFTKAWISFLRLPLPLDVYKEVLVSLHQVVIPHLSNPVILCDFLTRSYDIGGVISVMALSSLYILMTQHGLDYPNFYEKLYALLLPSIFMAKHRAKFFELLDSCLKSPLLPAYLAAAFAKILSRLALSVPPSGELVIIALLHNLLRRHPSINFLVHQEADDETDRDALRNEIGFNERAKDNTGPDVPNRKSGIDLFNYQEMDPAKSKAMRSSLWEIDTLRHHYCPAVSRFVLSLENDLTVRSKTTEITVKDFTSGSYATIFREELRRRIKQVPLAFYKSTPTFLFPDSDFVGWSFKVDKCEKQDGKSDISMPNEDFRYNSVKRQRVEDF